jgi:drug/metabolite transporter (DMT)-like permease
MAEFEPKVARKTALLADGGLLLCALTWGGNYVIVKDAVGYLPPLWLLALRFGFAFLLMTAVFHRRLLKITRREVIGGLVIGLFMFGAFASQTVGMQYTTAGKSAFITASYVVFIPFLAWIMYRKFPGIHNILSSFICLGGVALLVLERGLTVNPGDALMLLCAIFFAGNIAAVDYYVKRVDPYTVTIVETGLTALLSLGGALVFETYPGAMGARGWLSLLYLVTLGTLGTHLGANVAMRYTSPVRASIIFSMESVFAVVLAAIFLGDVFGLRMLGGFALIMGAIVLTETRFAFFSAFIRLKNGGESDPPE